MAPPSRVNNAQPTDVFGPRDPKKFYGVAVGTVTSTVDPGNSGRIQITLPSLPGASTLWASAVATPVTDNSTGYQVGDAVVVAFNHGELSYPVVLGRLMS